MTKMPAKLTAMPLWAAACLSVTLLGIPTGCDMNETADTRLLSGLVIQVDIVALVGKNALPLTGLQAVVTAKKPLTLDPKHSEATSQPPYHIVAPSSGNVKFGGKGTYYLLLPESLDVSDLKTIVFTMPGYKPLTIDYQTYPRVPYTPGEFSSISTNRKHPCAPYNELGAFKYTLTFDAFIQYVSQHLPFEDTAYAKEPKIPVCHLLFRQREEISVTIQPINLPSLSQP